MSLQCRVVEKSPGAPHAYLTGALDEHAPLETIFADLGRARGEALVVHMQGIIRVNSIGVRKWVREMLALSKGRQVTVSGISYPLAMQANNVANLMGTATVSSCMAPYFCAMCEANRMVEVTRDDLAATPVAPVKTCGDCGSPMEFDEVDEYFTFLRRP